MYDALVISDWHLGSDVCRAKEIVTFLEQIQGGQLRTERLILNGDIFDSHDFRRLSKSHWRVLSLLRKLSDNIETIWIFGNHDGPAEILSHLLGVNVANEYLFRSGPEKILLLHGDIYDDFLNAHPILTWVADHCYWVAQKIDHSSVFCRWLKQTSKTYLRCAELIEKKAIKHAHKEHATIVCCGHVHKAYSNHHDGVTYFNSGCWTESPCTYLSIQQGDVRINYFEEINEIPIVA